MMMKALGIVILALLAMGLFAEQALADPSVYSVTPLHFNAIDPNAGRPFPSSSGGISPNGQVVGWSPVDAPDNPLHAFLYSGGTGGTMTDLGTLDGSVSQAFAVNDSGQVVGQGSTASGAYHAFSYTAGTMTDLGTLGGDTTYAFGINATGQVVGQSWTSDYNGHAYLCTVAANGTHGPMTDLGTLGGQTSAAWAINNAGQVVGYSETSTDGDGNPHAFLYTGGRMTDLSLTPLLNGADSYATAINSLGQVVGYYTTSTGDTDGFLYTDGNMIDLGAGYQPTGINAKGQIIAGTRLYTNGVWQDINTLVDPSSYFTISELDGINDAGQIIGVGMNDSFDNSGGPYSVLLNPTPEPATLSLLLLGGIACVGKVIRRRRAA